MIKLFVGLGNPGPEYEATRHNAGFWWIDALARDLKLTLAPERSYHGLVARTQVGGKPLWLLEGGCGRDAVAHWGSPEIGRAHV